MKKSADGISHNRDNLIKTKTSAMKKSADGISHNRDNLIKTKTSAMKKSADGISHNRDILSRQKHRPRKNPQTAIAQSADSPNYSNFALFPSYPSSIHLGVIPVSVEAEPFNSLTPVGGTMLPAIRDS